MPQCTNGKTGRPKQRFLTWDEAVVHAVGSMHPYPCTSCGCFHVGHEAKATRRHKKKAKIYKFGRKRKAW
jgi:hypothetical protein